MLTCIYLPLYFQTHNVLFLNGYFFLYIVNYVLCWKHARILNLNDMSPNPKQNIHFVWKKLKIRKQRLQIWTEYNEYNERILNKIKTIKIIQKAGYSEQGWNSEMGSNIFMIKKIEDNYFLIFDFVTIFIDKLCCYRELVEC